MQIYIILFENQAIMSNSTELKFGLCTFSQIPRNPGIEGHRKRNARLGWDEGFILLPLISHQGSNPSS